MPEDESLAAGQAAFARALHNPLAPPPQAVTREASAPPVRRFNVYRNTVYAGLTGVIAARYPAVEMLMGADLFKAAARMFVGEQPPASPVLLDYGEGFASFLAGLELIDDMPHITDVARLEWLMHAARNAADAVSLRADDLSAIASEDTGALTFALAPSCSLLSSEYAVFSLWRSSIATEPIPFPTSDSSGEQVLVSRRGLEAEAVRLPRGAFDFISALMQGATLGEAAVEAFACAPDFPLDRVMALLISQETLSGFTVASPLNKETSP
jgi:hypothetical protein